MQLACSALSLISELAGFRYRLMPSSKEVQLRPRVLQQAASGSANYNFDYRSQPPSITYLLGPHRTLPFVDMTLNESVLNRELPPTPQELSHRSPQSTAQDIPNPSVFEKVECSKRIVLGHIQV